MCEHVVARAQPAQPLLPRVASGDSCGVPRGSSAPECHSFTVPWGALCFPAQL